MEAIIGFVLGFLADFLRSVLSPASTEAIARLVPSLRRKSNVQDNLLVLEVMEKLKGLDLDPSLAQHMQDDAKRFTAIVTAQNSAFIDNALEILDDSAMTQLEMNEVAADRASAAEAMMQRAVDALVASGILDDLQQQELIDAQKAWKRFSESNAALMAGNWRGGSAYATIYFSELERMAIARTGELRASLTEFQTL